MALTRLGLGCAQLGGLYEPMAEADAHALVDAAWDLGIRYFDTAPYYGFTLSEHRLGAALRARPRGDYVISTKVGRLMWPDPGVRPGECGWAAPLPFRPHYDYTYDGVMRSYEDSLQRLGLDRVDMLYVHDIGRVTHGERHAHYWKQLTEGGGIRALEQLRDEGAIKGFGLGVNEWEVIADALDVCALDCVLLAGRYTLLEQASLVPLMDRCARGDGRRDRRAVQLRHPGRHQQIQLRGRPGGRRRTGARHRRRLPRIRRAAAGRRAAIPGGPSGRRVVHPRGPEHRPVAPQRALVFPAAAGRPVGRAAGRRPAGPGRARPGTLIFQFDRTKGIP
jgi:hypothetical protein